MPLFRNAHFAPIFTLLFLFIAQWSFGTAPQDERVTVSSLDQVKEDTSLVPCKNNQRLNAVKALFEKMGVAPSDISIEKYHGVENITAHKPGSSQNTIIIGAHYDHSGDGCGAIDNWSGIVALAHIYKSLKNVPMKKSLLFVGFGKEEKGLVGSRAMVKAINKDKVGQYCAMINIDSLGLGPPQVATNISSKKLTVRAASLAQRMGMPFGQGPIRGISDSVSFMEKKISALTIHGLSDGYEKIIHTGNDQPVRLNATSVYLGYNLALALAVDLDSSACDAHK